MSLLEVYDYLKKVQLSDSLHLIGNVNAAMKYGANHLQKENLPQEVLVWLGRATSEAIRINIYYTSQDLPGYCYCRKLTIIGEKHFH